MPASYLVSAGLFMLQRYLSSWPLKMLSELPTLGSMGLVIKGFCSPGAVVCEFDSLAASAMLGALHHPSCVSDFQAQNLEPQNLVAPPCQKCSSLHLLPHGFVSSSYSLRLGG